MQAVKK